MKSLCYGHPWDHMKCMRLTEEVSLFQRYIALYTFLYSRPGRVQLTGSVDPDRMIREVSLEVLNREVPLYNK